MKKTIFLLLFLIFNNYLFCQTHNCNTDKNLLKIYKYIDLNFDSISKKTDAKILDIVVNFKGALIEKIDYYSVGYVDGKTTNTKNKISTSSNLDKYIRSIYLFCPSLDFDSEEHLIYNSTIRVPLIQTELKKAIKIYPDYSITHNSIKEYNNIEPNSNFKIIVKKLNLDKEEKSTIISSQLNYYDSDFIKIGSLYYLYFKINKSSENGIPYSLINKAKKKVERGKIRFDKSIANLQKDCLLYTSPSPRD